MDDLLGYDSSKVRSEPIDRVNLFGFQVTEAVT